MSAALVLALAGARIASVLRGGAGARVAATLGKRPQRPLELYEFEACPFCRRVREAITELDLEVLIHPCPKGGRRHRETVLALGGREQFPYLVDPNTGIRMYESLDIVAYLQREYGAEPAPAAQPAGAFATIGLLLSGLGRGTAGSRARAARTPLEPLVLDAFEADPASRLVRERLCELELDYQLRPAAPGSRRRAIGTPAAEPAALPRLVDPNTGRTSVGLRPILDHLEQAYALSPRRG
jgi:glutaredoxin